MESGGVVGACGWECTCVRGASGGECREQGVECYYKGWVFGDVKGLKWKVVEMWGLVVESVVCV